MSKLSRFQLDLTTDELESIERWSSMAGFRTKKEFLLNAFTMFTWAAQQVMLGRTICAVNEATGEVRHLEMPALAAVAGWGTLPPLSPEERGRRMAEPGQPGRGTFSRPEESAMPKPRVLWTPKALEDLSRIWESYPQHRDELLVIRPLLEQHLESDPHGFALEVRPDGSAVGVEPRPPLDLGSKIAIGVEYVVEERKVYRAWIYNRPHRS